MAYTFNIERVRTYLVKDGSMDPLTNDCGIQLLCADSIELLLRMVQELARRKGTVGEENWELFQDSEVVVSIDGRHLELEIAAICGSVLETGLEAGIQNKAD